jgi:pimeloyl-ACP methyl ester carboxylesterase
VASSRGCSAKASPSSRRPTHCADQVPTPPYLNSFLQTISGPIVLVAHSYGGFATTNAATGNPNIKALVYIDAFIPDEGETRSSSSSCPPPPAPASSTRLTPPSTSCQSRAVARTSICVSRRARLGDPSGPPAWKAIPSWSLIGTQDHVIPPALQEFMSGRASAVIETVKAGHLSLISRPGAVTKVIEAAVAATS